MTHQKNDFGPAAILVAMGLAIAAIIWAGGHAKGAELKGAGLGELDGGTTLKYDIAVKETGGSPVADEKGFKYTAPHNPALDLPFKMAVGFSAKGPDGEDHPLTFNVIKEGFATEKECLSEKGVKSPKFRKFVETVAKVASQRTGAVVTATAGCIDARLFDKHPELKDAVPEAPVPPSIPKHVPGEEKL